MRHAKSSWDNDRLADFDRPLNDRGRRAAPRMGKLLVQQGVAPDRIIASSANRAAETARLVAQAVAYEGEIQFTRDLYLADAETYLELARQVDSEANTAMLVGHNPDIAELVSDLSGSEERMPTAAIAVFRFRITDWSELNLDSECELAAIWRPKELSDNLR
jgi:phosphohistidine phosphatase